VTDVIDGSLGTDARATARHSGNMGIGSADRIIDDLLSSDEEAGITPDNSRRARRRRGSHPSFGPRSARAALSGGKPEERVRDRSRITARTLLQPTGKNEHA
jgi:hypothetical protein